MTKTVQLPTISVIIPCYKCSETIERAIQSIAHQTVLPTEVILVEDSSGDDNQTFNLLIDIKKKYDQFFSIIVLQTPSNSGPASARNLGLKLSKSNYIAFLDADDSWHPQKLEIQIALMEKYPSILISGHSLQVIDKKYHSSSYPFNIQTFSAFDFVGKYRILLGNPFSTPTIVLRNHCGFTFLENHRAAEDYFLWMKIILTHKVALRINVPLAFSYKNHFGEAGLSKNLVDMEMGEIKAYLEIYKLGLMNLVTLMIIIPFSFAKFLKRIFQTYTRKLFR